MSAFDIRPDLTYRYVCLYLSLFGHNVPVHVLVHVYDYRLIIYPMKVLLSRLDLFCLFKLFFKVSYKSAVQLLYCYYFDEP